MSGIILYKSKYGATRKYAEWLSERTGFSYIETDKLDIGRSFADHGHKGNV